MKIAYFDCFAGITARMVLGAFIDAGINFKLLEKELNGLNIRKWELSSKKVIKNTISATFVEVITKHTQKKIHNLGDITELIDRSSLSIEIKKNSLEIFLNLAKAEAKVHNITLKKVHFHEVGSIENIIYIIGTSIAIKNLGIEKIYSSAIHTGEGFVKCQHGTIPLPAPATAELLINVPVYSLGYKQELITPTGAAIIKTFVQNFGSMPLMKIEKVGYGVGNKNFEIPHLLRIIIGEM